ncbi:MAG: DUF481 domain-containing protein [Hyphomicrobiales bacterium]|jgi:hypothetical protein|nr:DUF481 domain-containing protein [Hyphomicrobiales bacterium]|tara:strand:+ start:148 stop:810 length:663 start_codon:yes stop_codon:yes gene_type:complete
MESSRKEGLIGSHFQINIGLNGSSGTVDRTNYSLEGRVDVNSDKWQRFGILSYKREEKDNSITSNNTFLHLRGVRKISPLLAVEGFIQLSEKPLQKIKRRELIGAGIRLSPYKSIKVGLGVFNEDEERVLSKSRETVRINSYITNSFNISESASFESTLYIQPDIEDFSELRSYLVLGLRLKISERFSSIITYENTHDSSPPPLTDKSNSFYGVKFSFEY